MLTFKAIEIALDCLPVVVVIALKAQTSTLKGSGNFVSDSETKFWI